MNVEKLSLPGALLIKPKIHTDLRGYFVETYNARLFREATALDIDFVQDNHSLSTTLGTVRGLHLQMPPYGQGKLIRCTSGWIKDIIVDVRRGSPSFGRHTSILLSADNGYQVWIPEGFLHGFVTLSDNTEVQYKCSAFYNKSSEVTIDWADKDLQIDWGIKTNEATLSATDKRGLKFKNFESPFSYSGD